jgi:hypothetical protein
MAHNNFERTIFSLGRLDQHPHWRSLEKLGISNPNNAFRIYGSTCLICMVIRLPRFACYGICTMWVQTSTLYGIHPSINECNPRILYTVWIRTFLSLPLKKMRVSWHVDLPVSYARFLCQFKGTGRSVFLKSTTAEALGFPTLSVPPYL